EGEEQPSGLGAQYIFQDAGLQVVLEFVARRVLAIFQQARIATGGRRGAAFLDFAIGRVCKAQDRLIKLLAELVLFGEQLQTLTLGFEWRVEDEVAFAYENRSCDLA